MYYGNTGVGAGAEAVAEAVAEAAALLGAGAPASLASLFGSSKSTEPGGAGLGRAFLQAREPGAMTSSTSCLI